MILVDSSVWIDRCDRPQTIDVVIATRCIESGYDLLHNNRDFDPFVKHLGLTVVI